MSPYPEFFLYKPHPIHSTYCINACLRMRHYAFSSTGSLIIAIQPKTIKKNTTRSPVYFKFYTNNIKVTYFFANLFGLHDSQHCGASAAPSYAYRRHRYGSLHLHVVVALGGNGERWGHPGLEGTRDSKMRRKKNILNEKIHFMRSNLFKIFKKITGNSINIWDCFNIISVWGRHCVYSSMEQKHLATPLITCGCPPRV